MQMFVTVVSEGFLMFKTYLKTFCWCFFLFLRVCPVIKAVLKLTQTYSSVRPILVSDTEGFVSIQLTEPVDK